MAVRESTFSRRLTGQRVSRDDVKSSTFVLRGRTYFFSENLPKKISGSGCSARMRGYKLAAELSTAVAR